MSHWYGDLWCAGSHTRLPVLTVPVRPTFLGIAMALFFQCMNALLGLADTIRGGLRWALVAYTVALFSFLTMPILIDMCYLSLEYINNRGFAGCDEYFPGPLGYDELLNTKPTATFYDFTFPMNQWLADGLLVGTISSSVAWVFNVVCSCSCIVATPFIP